MTTKSHHNWYTNLIILPQNSILCQKEVPAETLPTYYYIHIHKSSSTSLHPFHLYTDTDCLIERAKISQYPKITPSASDLLPDLPTYLGNITLNILVPGQNNTEARNNPKNWPQPRPPTRLATQRPSINLTGDCARSSRRRTRTRTRRRETTQQTEEKKTSTRWIDIKDSIHDYRTLLQHIACSIHPLHYFTFLVLVLTPIHFAILLVLSTIP